MTTEKINLPYMLSKEEIETRDLMNTLDWSPANVAIAHVFRALHHAALPQERIEQVAKALLDLTECDLTSALQAAVKKRVLRSRTNRGTKLYEVNY